MLVVNTKCQTWIQKTARIYWELVFPAQKGAFTWLAVVGRCLGAVFSVWGMFQRGCVKSVNSGGSKRDFSKVYPSLRCGVERVIEHGAGGGVEVPPF